MKNIKVTRFDTLDETNNFLKVLKPEEIMEVKIVTCPEKADYFFAYFVVYLLDENREATEEK